jgi:hypothetical protein
MKISEEVYRVKDRDIIKVTLPDGTVQPFYKSSGRNSGMKGTWLSFDGIRTIALGLVGRSRDCSGHSGFSRGVAG